MGISLLKTPLFQQNEQTTFSVVTVFLSEFADDDSIRLVDEIKPSDDELNSSPRVRDRCAGCQSRRSGGWGARNGAETPVRTARRPPANGRRARRKRTELKRTRGRRRARLVERASVEARAPRDESERHRDGASGTPDPARAFRAVRVRLGSNARRRRVGRSLHAIPNASRASRRAGRRAFHSSRRAQGASPVIRANLAHAVRPRRGSDPSAGRRPARAVRGADRRVAPGPAVLRPR